MSKQIAIMQPYFLAYLGYWKLMASVDEFIVLDDVTFIKKGWINRNRICVAGNPYLFTIPLVNASQNRTINEIDISADKRWKDKLVKTVAMNYKNSMHFDEVFPFFLGLIENAEGNLADYLYFQLIQVRDFLGLDVRLGRTSVEHNNIKSKGESRIIDICKSRSATYYINLPGGTSLYDRSSFNLESIQLSFLSPKFFEYSQNTKQFLPSLSLLDVLMNVHRPTIQTWLLTD